MYSYSGYSDNNQSNGSDRSNSEPIAYVVQEITEQVGMSTRQERQMRPSGPMIVTVPCGIYKKVIKYHPIYTSNDLINRLQNGHRVVDKEYKPIGVVPPVLGYTCSRGPYQGPYSSPDPRPVSCTSGTNYNVYHMFDTTTHEPGRNPFYDELRRQKQGEFRSNATGRNERYGNPFETRTQDQTNQTSYDEELKKLEKQEKENEERKKVADLNRRYGLQ